MLLVDPAPEGLTELSDSLSGQTLPLLGALEVAR